MNYPLLLSLSQPCLADPLCEPTSTATPTIFTHPHSSHPPSLHRPRFAPGPPKQHFMRRSLPSPSPQPQPSLSVTPPSSSQSPQPVFFRKHNESAPRSYRLSIPYPSRPDGADQTVSSNIHHAYHEWWAEGVSSSLTRTATGVGSLAAVHPDRLLSPQPLRALGAL